jgi:hypothetical protein
LALNAHKDRYVTGETARIDFGVLDDDGEIVCEANLTLAVTAPDGSTETFASSGQAGGGEIVTTGTCGLKEAGFIEPDFTTSLVLPQAGIYELTLTAETPNGIRSINAEILVEDDPQFLVKRTAATRLWPFAPSPMTIDITFGSTVSGMVVERLPEGFELVSVEPDGIVVQNNDGTKSIRWRGEWQAGDTATFTYDYDAPDVSPQFYLLGPLRILTDLPAAE